jgi:hypothetical protein
MVSRSITIGPAIWEELDCFDKNLKSKFIRAFRFLSRDIHHPSLQVEYINEGDRSFYRARVDPKRRFHFELKEPHYVIIAVGPHRLQGID